MIPLVRLLLPFAVLRPILDGTGGIPISVGRPEVRSKQAAVETAVMLIAGTILIWRYGAVGAAISAGLVVLAPLIGLYFWYVKDSLDIPWRRTFLVPILSALAAAGAAAWAGSLAAGWAALALLALKTAVFGAVFGALMLAFHRAALLETFAIVLDIWRRRAEG
jgi:O-antigen/teichoic acid export membrane protein